MARWGLEGPVAVDAVPFSAVDLCDPESLPEDLLDLQLGPEARELMHAPQVSLPLGTVPIPAEVLAAAMHNASVLIYGPLWDTYIKEMGRLSRALILGPLWSEFLRRMKECFRAAQIWMVFNAIFQGFFVDLLQQEP